MRSVNLIPSPRRNAKRRRILIRRWVAICVAYGGVLFAISTTSRAVWDTDCDTLDDRIKTIREQNNRSGRAMVSFGREIREAQMKLRANQAIGKLPDWSVLLAMIARNLGKDAVLTQCRLVPIHTTPDGRLPAGRQGQAAAFRGDWMSGDPIEAGHRLFSLELTGLGRSQMSVSRFVLRLERTGLFDTVKRGETTRKTFLDDKAIAFRLVCTFGGENALKE